MINCTIPAAHRYNIHVPTYKAVYTYIFNNEVYFPAVTRVHEHDDGSQEKSEKYTIIMYLRVPIIYSCESNRIIVGNVHARVKLFFTVS